MKITKTKLKEIIKEELQGTLTENKTSVKEADEALGWKSEKERAGPQYQDKAGNQRPPRADEFAKQLFGRDRQKLLAFYQEVVSPWSSKSFTGDSSKPFTKGLQKYAPWLSSTEHENPYFRKAGQKLPSNDDVRFYMRAFHEDIVNLYGAAIKKEQEGSQARQKLLLEFQKILEETAGIQASYIVNVLQIPEFDYLKDRTGPEGDNKTTGGYMNEEALKKIIFEELKGLLG